MIKPQPLIYLHPPELHELQMGSFTPTLRAWLWKVSAMLLGLAIWVAGIWMVILEVSR